MEKRCQICGRDESKVEILPAIIARPSLVQLIKNEHPNWKQKGFICIDDLEKYRKKYLRKLIEDEKGELSDLELDVFNKLSDYEIISAHENKDYESKLTFGQKVADRIASFGGSWKFIIIFIVTLILWITVNSVYFIIKPFDPFPFILLNLVLSCIAALQAPVIMMSQNRQESRDRHRAEQDYKINLKSELELRQLHQKIDHLLLNQWERMTEIQELQIEILTEMRKSNGKNSKQA
ncbi:MAG: DUF1003 domain-containing protein [Syntrophothermus sp.]